MRPISSATLLLLSYPEVRSALPIIAFQGRLPFDMEATPIVFVSAYHLALMICHLLTSRRYPLQCSQEPPPTPHWSSLCWSVVTGAPPRDLTPLQAPHLSTWRPCSPAIPHDLSPNQLKVALLQRP
ncbi:hypothetical protein GOP47_0025097 [Adiantum capillus-veneris]|uniref:Uncharacterized protein n=1 Tax=Adiantum capillus-veneris TaxID=13818 RepID=A0A9D4U3G1_ADICA|nr:hypothetical protein GOP47_0025097 [Adiantum capillus-veneris]